MSELVDKQVNVQKESLKKLPGFTQKLPQAHEKVCDENETKKQRKQVDELPSKNQALCAFCVTCIVLLCVNLLYSLCKLNHS